MHVAIDNLTGIRSGVNEPPFDFCPRVEHGKTVVVLGGKGEKLYPRTHHHVGPFVGVKPGRIPPPGETLVLLAVRGRAPLLGSQRPGFTPDTGDGVKGPVDPDAELKVPPALQRRFSRVNVIVLDAPVAREAFLEPFFLFKRFRRRPSPIVKPVRGHLRDPHNEPRNFFPRFRQF